MLPDNADVAAEGKAGRKDYIRWAVEVERHTHTEDMASVASGRVAVVGRERNRERRGQLLGRREPEPMQQEALQVLAERWMRQPWQPGEAPW